MSHCGRATVSALVSPVEIILDSEADASVKATGTDFIIAEDGRIAAVYLLFDKLP
jgi:hypothetical protein